MISFTAFLTFSTNGKSYIKISRILSFFSGVIVASLFVAASLLLAAGATAQTTGPEARSLEAQISASRIPRRYATC